MSFLRADNRIIKLESGFPKRKNNEIQFVVKGDKFPNRTDGEVNTTVYIYFNSPSSIAINWADGNVVIYDTDQTNRIRFGSSDFEYFYNDGNTGERIISINFQDPEKVTQIYSNGAEFEGLFPDLNPLGNLEKIDFRLSRRFNSFPRSFINLTNLEDLVLYAITENRFPQIPDSFFDLDLKTLEVYGLFDLSDEIESNYFKINQFNNIEILDLSLCNLKEIIEEVPKTSFKLTCRFNNFEEYPTVLEDFTNLEELRVGNSAGYQPIINNQVKFNPNHKNLHTLSLGFAHINLQNMITDWVDLVSLEQLVFQYYFDQGGNSDDFVDYFYELCTNEAYLDSETIPPEEEYPNKFRNITWGDGDITPTGAIQAPSGFVQDQENGTPANQGEKVYVLVNNYGHIVSVA